MPSFLVPVDGSKDSLRALDFAIAQAKITQSTIHILNVQQNPEEYGMVTAYMPAIRKVVSQRAQSITKAAAERVRRAGVAHQVHIVHDEIAPSIVRTARRLKCTSIIMGTRGLGAIASIALGSVALKVVHLSKVPVTLVK